MSKTIVSTAAAPAALGPYSQAVISGNIVFCSGQIGIDPATGNMPEGVEAQAEQSCKNVMALLASQGLDASAVVRTAVFITNMDDFAKVNAIYAKYFTEPFPARSCVGVAALPKGALVEIEATAVKG